MPARIVTAAVIAIAGPMTLAGPLTIAGPLALAWAASARADEPPSIAPFSAQYSADWESINVGTSDLDLKRNAADGTYEYTWRITARGVFRIVYNDDVIQRSWLTVNAGHGRPERYRAEQGGSTVASDFDCRGGR